MTKAEIIAAVQEKVAGLTRKDANATVDAVFEVVKKAICESKRLTYPGFGTFTVRTNSAREGRNPHTGAAIHIAEADTVKFKPAPKLKEALNAKKEDVKEVKKAAKKADKADKEVKEVKDDKKACKKACKKSK